MSAVIQRGFVAEPQVSVVETIDIRMSDAPLPYAVREETAIRARWGAAVALNPKLYDGPILLFSDVVANGGCLSATAHRIGFSALYELITVDDIEGRAKNVFGAAAVVGSDGICLMGRMSDTTAFPGTVKFPGGTPDDLDIRADGSVDILGSIVRELAEETGLDAAEGRVDPAMVVVWDGPLVAIHAIVRFDAPAADLARKMEAFIAREADPEMVAVVGVAPDDRLDGLPTPGYTRAFLRHFAGARA